MAVFSCKGCVPPVRHVGCHATCEKYIAEKAENDRLRIEEQKRHGNTYSPHSNGTYYQGKGHRKQETGGNPLMVFYDEKTEKFKRTLPCINCNYAVLCKYKDTTTKPIELPDHFQVSITCKLQQELNKPTPKEVTR